jgi:GTP cyclohydrolase I
MTDRQTTPPRDGAGREDQEHATHARVPADGHSARRARTAEPPLPHADLGLDLDQAPDRNFEFEDVVRRMLEFLGEDPDREGLLRTPQRVANALIWLTRGYETDVKEVVGSAVFEEAHENMVMVRDIELYSLCEHHLLPFFGKAHVAYIPDGKIVGLSKIPRIVDVFARRLQVQERLTEQIAHAVEEVLEPRGVGVVIEAYHLCMMMRGVEKQNSKTITSALRGLFRDDAKTREEFLYLAHASSGPLR